MHRRLLLLVLVLGLTLLFFHQMAFTDKILARGDTYNYFYPYWDVRNEAYRAGELPLWTPDIFMGAPLLANPQLGTFYPPNWLTAAFRTPTAIKISILLHSALAGIGMVFLYRTVISKSLLPALVAGGIFAFGGYVGSHVEQINQLQGLAWMPILFALYYRLLMSDKPLLNGLLMAMAWAMQIFSGHTQTVFMTGMGLGIYGLYIGFVQWREHQQLFRIGRAPMLLAVVAVIAALLAIPQLLPTLELTGMSNRGGGFNAQQATAFSLSPNTIGRAILPSYDSQLFGEYVTYVGIVGLGLALWGMVAKLDNSETSNPTLHYQKWAWITLAVMGLLLAFGRYNPLYLILAELPGFNLFRVPARWLSLFTLGMAMLAGIGVQALPSIMSPSKHNTVKKRNIFLVFLTVFIGGLIFLTRFVLEVDPRDVYGEATPQDSSMMIWIGTLVLLLFIFIVRHRWVRLIAVVCVVGELFLASFILPYNDLAPPEVYLGQRFTISQLLAKQQDELVPGRILSISRLFFDPGDLSALRDRYHRLGLDEQSQFHAVDAVKKQEMLMPNLSLTWGIPSVDGFGGGILPTIYYSQFTSLLLPEGNYRTVDGRLGELMAKPECRGACVPPLETLFLADLRYIITDKVFDVWVDGVAYDTSLAEYWKTTRGLEQPGFEFDEVRLLHEDRLEGFESTTTDDSLWITVMDWAELQTILRKGNHTILGVTLVDSRFDSIFLQLTPSSLRRVLSSDIKIYEFQMSTSLRAFIATNVEVLPDDWQGHEVALEILRNEEGFVIHGDTEPRDIPNDETLNNFEATEFVDYTDTQVTIEVSSETEAYLILNDAYYPGWKATVNGEPVPVYRANVMFRAVPIPAGESTVVFYFEPDLWRTALMIGGVVWMIIGIGLLIILRR